MKRSVCIIIAFGVVASLHIYTLTRARDDRTSDVQTRQRVDILSPAARLADIDSCRPGDRVTVGGRVSAIWEPAGKRAPHIVVLRDGSGALEVVHWLKGPLRIEIGDSVTCTGTIDLYRGELQLRLWSPDDVAVLDR